MFRKFRSLREYLQVFLADFQLVFGAIRDRRSAHATEFQLRRNVHRLEKGLRNPQCRVPFGLAYAGQTRADFLRLQDRLPPQIRQWAQHVLDEYAVRHGQPVEPPAPQALAGAAPPPPDSGPDTYEVLRQVVGARSSCRHFAAPAPTPAQVADLLHDMDNIPTSCNREAYKALVVQAPAVRDWLLANSIGLTNFSGTEHCTVVAFAADLSAVNHPRDRHVPVIDCSFASLLLALAAQAKGLATCYLNWPIRPSIDHAARQRLGLRPSEKIVFCMLVGHARADTPSGKSAKSGRVQWVR